jgi:hypothetical protein
VPARQPKDGRLWDGDGPCIRLRPKMPLSPSSLREQWPTHGGHAHSSELKSYVDGSGFAPHVHGQSAPLE